MRKSIKNEQTYRDVIHADGKTITVGVYRVDHNSRRVVRNLIAIENYDTTELVAINCNYELRV